MSRLRRLGWARSIGAALTLAGVAVVFVVVILPTVAFGSSSKSEAAKGGCKIAFKRFLTDKNFRVGDPGDSGDEPAAYVAIFGSNLDRVDDVQFKADTGSKIEYVSASSWSYSAEGYILASPPSGDDTDGNALGISGKIRLVDFDPDPDCVKYSPGSYTPTRVS